MPRSLRIMLADPPLPRAAQLYQYPAIGSLYLAGAIRQAFPGTDVEVRYRNAYCSLREHLKAITDYRPDIYGLSFTTAIAFESCETMKAVRAAFPDLPIITGGAHPSSLPEDVLDNSPANACFRGECEHTLVELISRWNGKQLSFEGIPGVVFRDGTSYVGDAPAAVINDLDRLPWPAWDMINPRQFPGYIYQKGHPSVGVVASRGCPWQCNFCSKPLAEILGGHAVRFRTPDRVVEEVEHLYQNGVREVRLFADELNANIKWACVLLNGLAALGHRDLYFNSNLRADNVTEELAQAMQDANLWLVHVGIESASQRSLDGVGKKLLKEQVEPACGLLKRHGITVFGNFIVYPFWDSGNGLEFEDTKGARETIRYAIRLRQQKLIDYMSISVITPRPASRVWDLAKKHDLFRVPTTRPFYYLERGASLPGISRGEMERTLMFGRFVQAAMALTGDASNRGVIFRALRKRATWMGSDVPEK